MELKEQIANIKTDLAVANIKIEFLEKERDSAQDQIKEFPKLLEDGNKKIEELKEEVEKTRQEVLSAREEWKSKSLLDRWLKR